MSQDSFTKKSSSSHSTQKSLESEGFVYDDSIQKYIGKHTGAHHPRVHQKPSFDGFPTFSEYLSESESPLSQGDQGQTRDQGQTKEEDRTQEQGTGEQGRTQDSMEKQFIGFLGGEFPVEVISSVKKTGNLLELQVSSYDNMQSIVKKLENIQGSDFTFEYPQESHSVKNYGNAVRDQQGNYGQKNQHDSNVQLSNPSKDLNMKKQQNVKKNTHVVWKSILEDVVQRSSQKNSSQIENKSQNSHKNNQKKKILFSNNPPKSVLIKNGERFAIHLRVRQQQLKLQEQKKLQKTHSSSEQSSYHVSKFNIKRSPTYAQSFNDDQDNREVKGRSYESYTINVQNKKVENIEQKENKVDSTKNKKKLLLLDDDDDDSSENIPYQCQSTSPQCHKLPQPSPKKKPKLQKSPSPPLSPRSAWSAPRLSPKTSDSQPGNSLKIPNPQKNPQKSPNLSTSFFNPSQKPANFSSSPPSPPLSSFHHPPQSSSHPLEPLPQFLDSSSHPLKSSSHRLDSAPLPFDSALEGPLESLPQSPLPLRPKRLQIKPLRFWSHQKVLYKNFKAKELQNSQNPGEVLGVRGKVQGRVFRDLESESTWIQLLIPGKKTIEFEGLRQGYTVAYLRGGRGRGGRARGKGEGRGREKGEGEKGEREKEGKVWFWDGVRREMVGEGEIEVGQGRKFQVGNQGKQPEWISIRVL